MVRVSRIHFFLVTFFLHYSFLISRPLNILFIVGHFPAPSQTFILNQITGLIDRGHNVSIFSFCRDSLSYIHPDILKYKLLDRVVYKKFPKNLPNCDVVFCQFGYHGRRIFRLAYLKPWLSDKKVVTCFRGSDITVRLKKKSNTYDHLFKKGDLFLPVCNHFKKRLIRFGCLPEKVVVHYSAIDCSKFFFKQRSLPKKGPIKLISVCRLVEKKGIKYAISAVAQVVQQHPNIVYHIVGDGPEYAQLESLIKKLNMHNNIILHGWKSQDVVVKMLDSAHVFLLPSVTALDGNEEGIPNAIKEAMAMGLPVIATAHAGNPELVESGVSGYLVSEKNVQEISDKIVYLIEHPDIWLPMEIAARKVIEERFETKKTVEKLEGLFYQLLSESV